ncbi:MAG: DivIVA domain-containing protein [Phycisphaerae bacterium]|nr:DivIVA domain-containing protein [Phycisphaerae bacterium]
MTETIETFVAKLQEEGVQAGQAAAEKLKTDADAQAKNIIADAEAQAKKIVADAETQARNLLDRSKTDLKLAARDTVSRLRETLCDCLNAVIAQGARDVLSDLDFLGKTLHDIVMLYAQADLERKLHIDINVPGEIQQDLRNWALKELGRHALAEIRPSFDLKGRLQQVGFEYSVGGVGTVEVTLDSVVDMLSHLVTPALRDVLAEAAKE